MASLSWMMTFSVRRKNAWEEVLLVRADMEANCSSHGGFTFVAPLIMTHSLVNLCVTESTVTWVVLLLALLWHVAHLCFVNKPLKPSLLFFVTPKHYTGYELQHLYIHPRFFLLMFKKIWNIFFAIVNCCVSILKPCQALMTYNS